jgi:hypothetical protein
LNVLKYFVSRLPLSNGLIEKYFETRRNVLMDLVHELVKTVIDKWKNGKKEYLNSLSEYLNHTDSFFHYILSFIQITFLESQLLSAK